MCISLEGWKARKIYTLVDESSLEFCNIDFYENRIKCWFCNKSVTENYATFIHDYISWVTCPPVRLATAWFELPLQTCSPGVHGSLQVCLYVLALQTGFKTKVSYCAAFVQVVTNLKPPQSLIWMSHSAALLQSLELSLNLLAVEYFRWVWTCIYWAVCLPEWW